MKKLEINIQFNTALEEKDNCICIDRDDIFALINFDEEFTRDMFIKSNLSGLLLDLFYESKYKYGIICVDDKYCNKYDVACTNTFDYLNHLKYVCKKLKAIADFSKVIIIHNNQFDPLMNIFKFDCIITTVEEILRELNKERYISIYSGNQNINLKYSFFEDLKDCDIESDILENNLLITNPMVGLRIKKKESDRYEVSHLHEEDE